MFGGRRNRRHETTLLSDPINVIVGAETLKMVKSEGPMRAAQAYIKALESTEGGYEPYSPESIRVIVGHQIGIIEEALRGATRQDGTFKDLGLYANTLRSYLDTQR